MKKHIIVIIFVIMLQTNAFSVGLYENTNQSAEFIRTLSRYASTDVDAVYYNPAGTAYLKDGLYCYISNQIIFDKQKIDDSSLALKYYNIDSSYKGNAHSYVFPDLYIIHKKDRAAVFFHLGVIGRGGIASFNNGQPGINKLAISYTNSYLANSGDNLATIAVDQQLQAYSFFLGGTVGCAYAINNYYSVGLGVRYIRAFGNTQLTYRFLNVSGNVTTWDNLLLTGDFRETNIDVSNDASCYGFIGGIDITPTPTINIGVKLAYHTTLLVKNNKPDRFEGPPGFIMMLHMQEGAAQKNTLPPQASFGIAIMVTPVLQLNASISYFFNKLANWGRDNLGHTAKDYDNGYDLACAVEYAVYDQLKVSIGYSYTVSGVNSKVRYEGNFGNSLPAHAVGLGGTYSLSEYTDITLAGLYAHFMRDSSNNPLPDTGTQTFSEQTFNVAIGIKQKIL